MNQADTFGEIIESFNLNLSKKLGKISVSQKLKEIFNETSTVDAQVPDTLYALHIYGSSIYLIAEDHVYCCSVTSDPSIASNWTVDSSLPTTGFSFDTDATTFQGNLIISQSTDITSYDGNIVDTDWWDVTIAGDALNSGYPHMLHVHRGGQETLFVTDKNKVHYYNQTATHSTIELQPETIACCVSSGISATWVGTYTEDLESAYVYEVYVGEQVDSTPVARNAYKIDGRAVLAIHVINNVPYIITDRGSIQMFNGAGFQTVATFPFAYSGEQINGVRAGLVQDSSRARPVHPRGVCAHDDVMLISINSEQHTGEEYMKNTPSGVYEFDARTRQLTHRLALCTSTTDYGFKLANNSGAIIPVNNEYTDYLVIGESNKTGQSALYSRSTDTPMGYFVTSEIESGSMQDAFEYILEKAKTLQAGESIQAKYRTIKKDKVALTGVYASTTKFNVVATGIDIALGDEFTELATGKIAHITAIDESATVTSITLDTAIGVAGASENVYVENFALLEGTYTTDDGEYKKIGLNIIAPWIQFKVVMIGNIEMRQFLCKSNVKNEL